MGSKSRDKKTKELLGMAGSTAQGMLARLYIFYLTKIIHNEVYCYRCGEEIEDPVFASLDHKIPWNICIDAKEKFFDMENLTLSHRTCNFSHGASLTSIVKGNTWDV